jgi:RHS repeat-associated protein
MEFTGKERDAETGLDFFGARYFSGAQGRFTSPDYPFADWDPSNPQSWNLYGYVRNSPLSFVDPTGRACVVGTDGKESDDKSGGQSCADAHKESENNKPSVTVTAQQGSLWAFLTAPQVPRYVPDDKPLDQKGQVVVQELSKKIDAYPTICGGGMYLYAGKEISAGPVNGFVGGIKEFDSRSGSSQGALFELGGGQGVVAGGGYIGTVNGNGQAESSGLAYAGVGAHSPVAAGSVGVVGFDSGVGVYGEGFLFGRGGGVGAYANITSVGRCR